MRTVSINIIGKGNIGKVLLSQLLANKKRLLSEGLELRVTSIIGRNDAIYRQEGLTDEEVTGVIRSGSLDFLPGSKKNHGWKDVTREIGTLAASGKVVVDVTSEPISSLHEEWLQRGWSVVTANKKPLTGTADLTGRERYRYETTVGAGLPVIGSLRKMLETGDEILSVEGMMSGTIGYIFSACGKGTRFFQAVKEAKEKGYTEPDPRDDLSGMDIARKALILARVIGCKVDPEAIPVETLVPETLASCSVDTFLNNLENETGGLDKRFEKARLNGHALRYLAQVSPEGITVGIREVAGDNPFFGIQGPENMFLIRSKRYANTPLIIRGPGAGAEVTAAGVFADILELIHEMKERIYEKEQV